MVRQVLRLWRVCLAYGVDTDSFQALFPPLLLRPAVAYFHSDAASAGDGSTADLPSLVQEYVDIINILEVLCPARIVGTAPAVFDNVSA